MDKVMSGRIALFIALFPLTCTLPNPAAAQDNGPSVTPLLSTGTTVTGETLHYPSSGPAHVTAAIITLKPGTKTDLHKHGVPLFAYILEGEITVDYGDRGKRTYRQGDALMEAMDVAHFGADTGAKPVRILAVFMGAKGAADTIPVQ
jgi:quercetin dioxygenase-like cupin family protein